MNAFVTLVIRRLAAAILFIVVASSAALVLVRLAPGDAAAEVFLSGAGKTAVDEARARLDLDRPLVAHLGAWLAGLLTLDLGVSSRFERPVTDLLAERTANTAKLAGLALFVATLVGLPLGLLTGARPAGTLAAIVVPLSTALVACPPIVGVLGLLLFAVATGWLSVAPGSFAVPTLALALPLAAMLERLQAQATGEALSAPDLVAAAARGVPPSRLLWIHGARQSLRPVLGVYGIMIGTLFSGSLAVEAITAWPGLGRLMYDALIGRDLYLVAGCALAGASLIAIGNLMADVARAAIDPRLRERV